MVVLPSYHAHPHPPLSSHCCQHLQSSNKKRDLPSHVFKEYEGQKAYQIELAPKERAASKQWVSHLAWGQVPKLRAWVPAQPLTNQVTVDLSQPQFPPLWNGVIALPLRAVVLYDGQSGVKVRSPAFPLLSKNPKRHSDQISRKSRMQMSAVAPFATDENGNPTHIYRPENGRSNCDDFRQCMLLGNESEAQPSATQDTWIKRKDTTLGTEARRKTMV